MCRLLLVSFVAVLALAGCQKTIPSSTDHFGYFEGDVVATWNDDGRNMTLRETFTYVDAQNRTWIAPVGSVINGASIPSAFWSLIGGPFEGKYRKASVVHDVGCVEMRESWEDVHRMFYEACRCGGVDELKAKAIYYAVYHFGPRWQPVTQVVTEQRATPDGQIVEQEVTVQRVVRTDPPPPTPEEIEQVEAYVAEENPELEAIRRFNRNELHRRVRRGGHPSGRIFERPVAAAEHQGDPMLGTSGNDRFEGRRRPNWSGNRPGHIPVQSEDAIFPTVVSQEEQQWLINTARQYIEEQAGEQRPAEYSVQRAPGGFNVAVRFLHPDDDGQLVPYEGGNSNVRVSRRGQILEVTNGVETESVE